MSKTILLLPGDGIGPEIMAEAVKVIDRVNQLFALDIQCVDGLIGGASIDAHGEPLSQAVIAQAKQCDGILLGAVGGPKWDKVDRAIRPEKGLLQIRAALDLFANLRPAILYPQLADASSLKKALVADLDILIVRELTGGMYFGEPRGVRRLDNGERQGYNTMVYTESEIERIAHNGFAMAQKRGKRLCSVDKANVLEVSGLWRDIMESIAPAYPDVELSHMYVDNAAMQLVRAPKQFDVIVTSNLFGDILSDCAAMLTGSIGMLPSASVNAEGLGMYEPVHGSAPDIAGQGIANPLATILSVEMLLRYSLNSPAAADAIARAVGKVLDQGLRTADIDSATMTRVSTAEMGAAVVDNLSV
ncbi:MAG: 3-isopropylmalate dehydrogenase [Cellvibrionaceae bacterium]|nr:3-isopropylmalate dehydrogenase [Cellvibrionaceae bacterium]